MSFPGYWVSKVAADGLERSEVAIRNKRHANQMWCFVQAGAGILIKI